MKGIALLAMAGVLVVAGPAHARPGDLDKSFAKHGRFAWDPYGSGGSVSSMTLPDGLRPLLNVSASRNGTWAPSWVRLTARGRIASQTVMPAPATGAPMTAGDYALTVISTRQYLLARAGGQPVTLTPPDAVYPHQFAVDAAGRALVFGSHDVGAAGYEVWAVRFRANGELDTSYGVGGRVVMTGLSAANGVVVRRDSRAFVVSGEHIMALDGNGRPLPGFANGAVRLAEGVTSAYTLVEGPGETLLFAGLKGDSAVIGRVRANARLDARFGKRGLASSRVMKGLDIDEIARDRRGRLILVGTDTNSKVAVARMQARGRVDRTFGASGLKTFALGWVAGKTIVAWMPRTVAIDKRGRILVAGTAYDDNAQLREDVGDPYPAIARLKG